mgnify:CR=1 FL=1
MTRGGRPKEREVPERRCIVTRAVAPKAGLLRFVLDTEDAVAPDLAAKLPGRGFYVAADRATLAKAVARGAFARAARRPVRVPPDLPARVEALLATRLIEFVALARKAGEAVAGLEKTREALVKGRAALLLQAADGSERGKAALRPPPGPGGHVTCLTADELGLAFARDSVIHAAVLAGGLAERIRAEALRLAGVRGTDLGAQVEGDGGRDDRTAEEGLRAERQTTE